MCSSTLQGISSTLSSVISRFASQLRRSSSPTYGQALGSHSEQLALGSDLIKYKPFRTDWPSGASAACCWECHGFRSCDPAPWRTSALLAASCKAQSFTTHSAAALGWTSATPLPIRAHLRDQGRTVSLMIAMGALDPWGAFSPR